jgi:hypothetical protein
MLEICPPALHAYERRMPRKRHSHFRLCPVQRVAAAVRDRVTAPELPSLRTADSGHSGAQIATDLESCSCTSTSVISVESYSCKKSRGAPPPNPAAPLLHTATLSKIGVAARRFAVRLARELGGIRTRYAESQSPLECALTRKRGWGVSPRGGFLP